MSETWRVICKHESGTEQFEIDGLYADSTRSALVALLREKSGADGEYILKSGDGLYAKPLPKKNWSLSRMGLYNGAILSYATRAYTDEEKQQLAQKAEEEAQLKASRAARLAEREKEEKEKEEQENEEKEHESELKIAVSGSPETTLTSPTTPLSPGKEPKSPQKKGFLIKLFGKLGSSKVQGSEETEIPEDLKKTWKEMCQPKGTLSWMLVGYADGKTKKLTSLGSGKGGLAELRLKLDINAVQFGALRVVGLDSRRLSETSPSFPGRAKFVGFTVVGTKLTSPQKTLAMHAKEAFRDLFVGISTQMEISQLSDFTDTQIAKKLLTVSGSHQPAFYDFGNGQLLDVSTLK